MPIVKPINWFEVLLFSKVRFAHLQTQTHVRLDDRTRVRYSTERYEQMFG